MNRIQITHTPDGQRALVFVPEEYREAYPQFDEFRGALKEDGVLYGTNDEVLRTLVSMKVCGRKVEVARGKAPVPGKAGRIELLIDVRDKGRPLEREDGSVDHRDIAYVVNVSRGTPLAKRIPPDPGLPGTTVFGTVAPPPPVEDAQLHQGGGTCLDTDNEDILIANTDGALIIRNDGYIDVRTRKVIGHDVDYSTGNVSFSGDLSIRGAIRGGFTVSCTGNLTVGGGIENATAKSEGNIDIGGVAAGSGEGSILCKGELRVRQLERFKAAASRVIVKEAVLQSTVEAMESIRAATIIGGRVRAGVCITVGNSGNESETATHLHVSGTQELEKNKYDLLKELTSLANRIGQTKQALFALVRDQMDPGGTLSAEQESEFQELREKYYASVTDVSENEKRIGKLEQDIRAFPPSFIEAGVVYPGTIVQFGSYTKKMERIVRNTRISLSENGLSFENSKAK